MVFFLVTSCTKETNHHDSFSLESFIRGKTDDQIKSDFGVLSQEQKLQVWKQKLDLLTKQKFPQEHALLLSELRSTLEEEKFYDNLYRSKELISVAKKLIRITPDADFSMMFETLRPYSFQGKFVGSNYLSETELDDLLLTGDETISFREDMKKCNCRNLGCDFSEMFMGDVISKEPCEERRGCGFLWVFMCNGRVDPYERN